MKFNCGYGCLNFTTKNKLKKTEINLQWLYVLLTEIVLI